MEVGRRRDPEVPFPPARVVVEDDARYLPAFTHAGAVADHEPRASAVREEFAVLLTRVRHALQLELRELAIYHDVVAEGIVQGVGERREGDGRERRGLRDVSRVLDTSLRCWLGTRGDEGSGGDGFADLENISLKRWAPRVRERGRGAWRVDHGTGGIGRGRRTSRVLHW